MQRLFKSPPFVDFGPCILHTEPTVPTLERVQGARPAVLRAAIRECCPRQPGVYGMIDLHGELIYVGKAKDLRARLMTYFRPRSRDPKAGRIVAHARTIVWERGTDEFGALHRELELIRRWRPRWNVQGQPNGWQHTYICLGRPPAPYAFLAGRPPATALASFGPIQSGWRAREAVRRLNDQFQLRDCPQAQEMAFADQAGLFLEDRVPGCLRHELKTCLGPCAGACSQAGYAAQVRNARAFLSGRDSTPLDRLENAMKEAATQEKFERAAMLRDKLGPLAWLNRQLERMRQAEITGTVIYPLEGYDGILRWYLLHGGRAVAVVPASAERNSPSGNTLTELGALAEGRSRGGRPADRLAGVLLLTAWFKRYPRQRHGLLPLKDAQLC